MADFSMKRQRGRGRKPGGGGGNFHSHNNTHHHNQPNRAMESNGPEVKVRGPAAHIHERYLQLARDATAAGDRVLGENYAQHADHYFRLLRQMQPAAPPPQSERFNNDQDFDRDDEGSSANDDAGQAEAAPREQGDQPDAEFAGPQQQQQPFDRDANRRRGRRNRFRPGEGGEVGGGSEQRGDRLEQSQDSRPMREAEPAGPEGFSHSPKPAFLRGE